MFTSTVAATAIFAAVTIASPVSQGGPTATASYDFLATFDDLPAGSLQGPYQHLTWSNLYVRADTTAFNPASPPNDAFSEVSETSGQQHTILDIAGTASTSFDFQSFSGGLAAPVGRGGRDVAVNGKFVIQCLTTGGFGHDGPILETFTSGGSPGASMTLYDPTFHYCKSVQVSVVESDVPVNQTRVVFDNVSYTVREGEVFDGAKH